MLNDQIAVDATDRSLGVAGRKSLSPVNVDHVPLLFAAAEILALSGVGIAGLSLGDYLLGGALAPLANVVLPVMLASLYAAFASAMGLYQIRNLLARPSKAVAALGLLALSFLFFAGFAYTMGQAGELVSARIALMGAATAGTLFLFREMSGFALRRAMKAERVGARRVAILGQRDHLLDIDREELAKDGRELATAFGISNDPQTREEELDSALGALIAASRSDNIEEIAICVPWVDEHLLQRVLGVTRTLPIPVYLLPDVATRKFLARPVVRFGASSAVEMQRPPLNGVERLSKRAVDFVLALAVLSPLFLVVAALIKLDSPGPVLFRQTRVGFSGRPFRIYKFRSMTTLDDGPVIKQATRDDKRVTRVGAILRKTSLDELPQLVNVVAGTMSIVGPRPLAVPHVELMSTISECAFRHHVKPGITGWAQVNGYRGETPTLEHMERRVEHDLWYISNWSLWLDVKIIVKTMIAVVRPPASAY
jgi:Undecaprenyl-phosphate glucose phosphotransferase